MDGLSRQSFLCAIFELLLNASLTGRSEQREPRSGAAACTGIFDPAPVLGRPRKLATWDGKAADLDTEWILS
jgi:hypothetical protein